MLEKQHLRRAGFVVKVGLGFLAFLPAEGRIGQDHIEGLRRALEQAAIGFPPGQRVAVPEVRLIDAVQDEIRQGDGIDEVLFLAPPERPLFKGLALTTRS